MSEIDQAAPEEILDSLTSSVEVHQTLTEDFIDKLIFFGHTMGEWSKIVRIEIPRDPTPQVLRELLVKTANSLQMASHYYIIADSMFYALTTQTKYRQSEIINIIVNSFKKNGKRAPARAVIEQMAESYLSSTNHVKTTAKITRAFWKQKYDTLIEIRKILDQIAISQTTEMKYLAGIE